MFRSMLKLSNNQKRNQVIRAHSTHGILNLNYIFGYLLYRDIFLYRRVWTMPGLKMRFKDYKRADSSQHFHCYHQIVAPTASQYVELLIQKYYHGGPTGVVLGSLCKQCRIEMALRLPEIMHNFGQQPDEEKFCEFRALILNNCMMHYSTIKLLISNVDWLDRMMIEITLLLQDSTRKAMEEKCIGDSEPNERGYVSMDMDKAHLMEFTLRPIEMLTRCIGFFKEGQWAYLFTDLLMGGSAAQTSMLLLKKTLMKEAQDYNEFARPFIEQSGLCADIVQQILFLLSTSYCKIRENPTFFKHVRKDRNHQRYLQKLRDLSKESKRSKSKEKRNEIADALLLLFDGSDRGDEFLNMQQENSRIYHRWYRKFVKECQSVMCNRRKIMISSKKGRSSKFYRCKDCRMVYYCSLKCQKYDWNSFHRFNCDRLCRLHRKYQDIL